MAEELKACAAKDTATQILDLIMDECRYWHGRDEAQRGNFAILYAKAKEIVDKSPSQGGEAVEVVAWQDAENPFHTTAARRVMHDWAGNGYPIVELMTVAQHQRILAAATHPADQVEDDLTMVKVSRELLQDLRDLAFDQVEHHRAAMGAYKQTRQSAMDSVLAQADALLRT